MAQTTLRSQEGCRSGRALGCLFALHLLTSRCRSSRQAGHILWGDAVEPTRVDGGRLHKWPSHGKGSEGRHCNGTAWLSHACTCGAYLAAIWEASAGIGEWLRVVVTLLAVERSAAHLLCPFPQAPGEGFVLRGRAALERRVDRCVVARERARIRLDVAIHPILWTRHGRAHGHCAVGESRGMIGSALPVQ